MPSQINVSVFKRGKVYYAQYRDPVTGDKVRKSTGERRKGSALRKAAKWESDVRSGLTWEDGSIPWETFRDRYESECLPGWAESTQRKSITVLNRFEQIVRPRQLRHVNATTLSRFTKNLRDGGRSTHTLRSYLAHLRWALSWAIGQQLIVSIPVFPEFQVEKIGMKGRPITLEEFERMLIATERVILKPNLSKRRTKAPSDSARVPSWKHLLVGLWLSGLRLGEALALTWDDRSTIHVDSTGKHWMFRIPAYRDKSRKSRKLPMTPDFASFLMETPERMRHGFVFTPLPFAATNSRSPDKPVGRLKLHAVSRRLAQIGREAGVIVDHEKPSPVFASAHDLRRSFGERWSYRIQPKVLQELMRHASIDTTMKFYVGHNADRTAELLWDKFSIDSISSPVLGGELQLPGREP